MANAAFEQVIELVLQTSGDPEVLKLAAAIKELNTTAEVSDDAMGDFVRQLDELQKTAAASAGLERLTQRTQQLQQEQGELAAAVDRAGLRLQLQTRVQQEASEALERARAASAQVRLEQQQYAESGNKSLLVQRELKIAVKETADAQKAAERAFAQASTALNGATREYERAANAQEKLDSELASARTNLQAAQRASEGLGKSQADLARSLDVARQQALANAQALRATAEAAEATARRLADGDERFRRLAAASRTSAGALQRHRAAAAEAAQGQDRVNDSAQRGIGIFDRLRGVLASVGVFLGLREAGQAVAGIARIGDEAERTRDRLEGLYGTQEEANRVFGELRRIADENGQSFDAITEAAARLKGFGLDPLDGTLQSLIDQNTKLGGSQQQLEGIILAVGQAWSKQKLQGEEILQLVERGVPVWDLLAQATGKNVQELQRLSERGELGRETIQALLQEIGRASEGAAARGLSTLGAQFQLVRNRAQEFLETVANSGVLEFFKNQLAALNAEVRRLAADGTLTQYAKSVSDGIVATAEAVKSAVVFVRDYSGALILLGKAYLAVRFAPFIAGLAASAQGMVAAAVQARTLTGVVGGLGARLAAIPANIKIAIGIIAFDFLMGQFKRLNEAINAYQQSLLELESFEASQRQYARDRAALIEEVIRVYGKYADTQIKTQEQLNALGEGDLILYRQRLEAAERYFTAVQAKAKEANDAAALEDAQRRLGEFKTALDVVAEGFARIDRAKKAAFADQSQARDLADALKELGVSAQNAGNAITEEGEKILGVFARIVVNAESTGAQIGEAFNNALGRSQTVAEVERLGELLKTAFDKGRLSAEQFNTLMDATKARIKGIEDAASKAAGSFQQIVDAGEEATRALLATLDASRSQLAAKANQLAGAIAQGLRDGIDTSALQAQLAGVEGQINSTTVQINDTKAALDRFSASSDRAASSLGGISGAAGGASDALRSVEQAADDSFGNIGRGASTVTGGPLAALGAKFGELRDRAVALGGAAEEAFDSTLRVGERVRGTGFTIEQFYQRQIDRIKLATDTVEELERAYNNSNRSAQNLANTSADIAQNATLSLEAERERNLEYARQLLEVEKERAGVQQASVTALTQQVGLTRELASTRENLPPQKIELIAANRQKPGELLGELGDPAIEQIAQRVVQILGVSSRGITGQRFRI
jgi:tape measure domain-containing protein